MKCEDAGVFVSALCDGEVIPRAAAEHIGTCEVCHARFRDYAEMAAELRRVASMELKDEVRAHEWERVKRAKDSWWAKGWEDMRIPRFVFALLLMAVVVLGSSLVLVKARARNQETVLLLTAKPRSGGAMRCTLSLVDLKLASCEWFGPEHSFAFRVISRNGDRIQIGVRVGPSAAALKKPGGAALSMNGEEEKQYWLEPGKELEVAGPGAGTTVITGELTDHAPPLGFGPDEQLDPKPGELRFASPVLLRDKEVVQDFQGGTAIASDPSEAIEFYAPGDGLYRIALSQMEGAVEGSVAPGRVSFGLEGRSYTFLLAAPVTRSEHVWVLRDGNYQAPSEFRGHSFLATTKLSSAGAESPTKN